VLEDFKRALARVQSDFSFYIGCLTNPAVALEELLTPGLGISQLRITISGTHDWVNRARMEALPDKADHDSKVVQEVNAIKRAGNDRERTQAAVRLMELIG
jgi:hypothetical protein